MSLEMRSSPKTLPTKLTAESFDSRVELLVGFEGVGVYEGFSTVLASEGLFARVNPFVCLEVALLGKALPTVFAQVWLFSSVNSLVVVQVRLGEKLGAALQANKGLLAIMRSLVRSEDAYQGEALSTCGAGERSLVTVTHHVIPQVVGQAKHLVAERAFVRFFHLVVSAVDLEEASGAEALSTLLASVRCFSAVELLLVSSQVVEVGEGLSADFACVLLIACIGLLFFSGVFWDIQSYLYYVGWIQCV